MSKTKKSSKATKQQKQHYQQVPVDGHPAWIKLYAARGTYDHDRIEEAVQKLDVTLYGPIEAR